jgi:hypothetical protein
MQLGDGFFAAEKGLEAKLSFEALIVAKRQTLTPHQWLLAPRSRSCFALLNWLISFSAKRVSSGGLGIISGRCFFPF